MPALLVLLIILAVGSLATAAYVFAGEQSRRTLVQRASAPAGSVSAAYAAAGLSLGRPRQSIGQRLIARLPSGWSPGTKVEEQLIHAGYDGATAPIVYVLSRVALTVVLVLLTLAFAPRAHFRSFLLTLIAAAAIGWLLPTWYLGRSVRARQEKVRRSLPDCLDLLVVCIEAGISLDAALLRVAKDLGTAHPILARELLIINQKTNAGMPRQDALRGLWERTGVTEVRALVSHIVQGEKWGTSTGKVLRVYAETLRRERRQAAEKKAATAPVKMLVPLGIFIFPAILLVVMGPVVVAVSKMFANH